MKRKILFLALLVVSIGMSAQKGVDDGSRWGKGQDSIQCITNYSLFSESAKHKNYADALAPWEACYADCPKASVNLYIYGAQIVGWQYANAKTDDERQKYFEKLMGIFDQRIKYFGTSAKHPEGYILGIKAMTHMQYRAEDIEPIYYTLNKSVELMGDKSDPRVLSYYMDYTIKMFKANKFDANTVLANYDKITAAIPKTDEGKAQQNQIDQLFVSSGVANCETLTNLYSSQFEENKANVAWMNKALVFLSNAGCDQGDLYMQILDAQNILDKSPESAWRMGQRYYNKNDVKKAMEYFNQAITRSSDAKQKATFYYQMAQIVYTSEKNYPKTRELCNKAIEANPQYGAPYILIAQIYGVSAAKGTLGSSELQNRAGYWAAYDMVAKAKAVDSSEENQKIANSLLSQYKAQFPSLETVFMDPKYTAGKTITVGGWINVKTVIRTK